MNLAESEIETSPEFEGYPKWSAIGRLDSPVPERLVAEAARLLFAPDPSASELAAIDICMVLGSRNCGYKAERAADLFAEREEVKFVACGGRTSAKGDLEAELIRDVLVFRGVAPERILVDEHSLDTAGNLVHGLDLIRRHLERPADKRIAIVSSWFHRRHVFNNLPKDLGQALFVNAHGPLAGRGSWHLNSTGRLVILHELMRPTVGDSGR